LSHEAPSEPACIQRQKPVVGVVPPRGRVEFVWVRDPGESTQTQHVPNSRKHEEHGLKD